MKMKSKDVGFVLSLGFIIVIGAYWLIHDLKKENFDPYLSLLGEKLMAMIPESSEKRTIEKIFSNFKQNVEEKKVTPEQIEQVAAEIMNITNMNDTVSVEEAEAILGITVVIPEPAMVTPKPEPIKPPIDEKRWQELQKRIKSVYLFNETLKKKHREIAREPYLLYHIGNELQIIIDSKIKSDSLLEADSLLTKELKQLEQEKIVIWQDNLEKEIQEKMKEVEERIKIVNKNNEALKLAQIKILENLQIEKSLKGLDSLLIEADIHLDSLEIPPIDIKIEP